MWLTQLLTPTVAEAEQKNTLETFNPFGINIKQRAVRGTPGDAGRLCRLMALADYAASHPLFGQLCHHNATALSLTECQIS